MGCQSKKQKAIATPKTVVYAPPWDYSPKEEQPANWHKTAEKRYEQQENSRGHKWLRCYWKRVADAVRLQPDMELVGVGDVVSDYRVQTAVLLNIPIYASLPEKASEMETADILIVGTLDDLLAPPIPGNRITAAS